MNTQRRLRSNFQQSSNDDGCSDEGSNESGTDSLLETDGSRKFEVEHRSSGLDLAHGYHENMAGELWVILLQKPLIPPNGHSHNLSAVVGTPRAKRVMRLARI